MQLAVDVDGVIADQVPPVLERLNRKYGLEVTKDQIRRWNEPIADTDIKTEIEESLLDESFVLAMEPIEGATDALEQLAAKHKIMIATNRDRTADKATREWLSKNGIHYDSYINTSISGKGAIVGDILIDDYPGNLLAFSSKGRLGILFDQPWNQGDPAIANAVTMGSVVRARGWDEVVEIIGSASSRKEK